MVPGQTPKMIPTDFRPQHTKPHRSHNPQSPAMPSTKIRASKNAPILFTNQRTTSRHTKMHREINTTIFSQIPYSSTPTSVFHAALYANTPPYQSESDPKASILHAQILTYAKSCLMEVNGIEPMTPCLQSRCSPS